MSTNLHADAAVAAARAIALPDVCCVEDISTHLRVRPATTRRWLRSGTIPGRRVSRRWYVTRDALLGHIRDRFHVVRS